MKLAVSILNFRTPDLTLRSIQASIDALASVSEPWCIIVVDNDSQDGSENTLREALAIKQAAQEKDWDKVEIHQSGRNGGFGSGNNFAIRYARENYPDLEYVYVLNSDAFPDKAAIVTLIDFLDKNDQYGFAGSYIYGTDGHAHETAFRFPSVLGEFEGAIRFGPVSKILDKYKVPLGVPEASCDVDWLAGASMLMRIKCLEDIDIFDETFFLYFEETDLCLRAQRAGWKIRYILESKVAHIGSASTGMKQWDRIPSYWLDSRKYYFTKNHGIFTFYLATVFRSLAGAFYGLRCKIEGKQNVDPRCFIRDMLVHAFK